MKTTNQILTIIANQLAKIASDGFDDYKVIVCSERIFIDDYKPADDEYQTNMNDQDKDFISEPIEMPYQKTLFFVIKLGAGDTNMAVTNSPVSIQCMSEENDFVVAQQILRDFVASVNFIYQDEVIQSYFTPEVVSSSQEVYTGFRALLNCRGFIRIPEKGVAFVTDICFKDSSGNWFKMPFINMNYGHHAQSDPMSFAGYNGATMALNRQSTQTFSISTYLWYFEDAEKGSQEAQLNEFSTSILEAMNDMNKKFRIMPRTNIKPSTSVSEQEVDGEYRLPLIDAWFILADATYVQEWGNLSLWSFTFTRAKETES